MFRLLVPWPSQITLDLLPPLVVDRIGKSSKRVSNQPREFFSMQVLTPALFTTSYVILLLPQPSDFSPPSNLSGPNVAVSTFLLTDYISVRPTKLISMHPGLLIDSNNPFRTFQIDQQARRTRRGEFLPQAARTQLANLHLFFSRILFQGMYFQVQEGAANASIPTTSPVVSSTLKVPTTGSATASGSGSASTAKQSGTHNAATRSGSLNSLVAIPASLVILLASYVCL
jgi:hypothetical protein